MSNVGGQKTCDKKTMTIGGGGGGNGKNSGWKKILQRSFLLFFFCNTLFFLSKCKDREEWDGIILKLDGVYI